MEWRSHHRFNVSDGNEMLLFTFLVFFFGLLLKNKKCSILSLGFFIYYIVRRYSLTKKKSGKWKLSIQIFNYKETLFAKENDKKLWHWRWRLVKLPNSQKPRDGRLPHVSYFWPRENKFHATHHHYILCLVKLYSQMAIKMKDIQHIRLLWYNKV